ncbi:MAG: hypothetical protein V1648_00240, partial [Candidatus Aenigmatarchaeota archaeon]
MRKSQSSEMMKSPLSLILVIIFVLIVIGAIGTQGGVMKSIADSIDKLFAKKDVSGSPDYFTAKKSTCYLICAMNTVIEGKDQDCSSCDSIGSSTTAAAAAASDTKSGPTLECQTELGKTIVIIPNRDEQKKIAACLSSVDGLIAAQARKVDALKLHKKGLMQQLFPAVGQTVPALRFPEFRHAPAWEEKLFEALYDFKPNNNYSRDQLNYNGGAFKNIHYGDIHTRFSTHFHIDAEEVPFVNDDVLPNEVNPESLCRPGDMIFADASEDLVDVGKCI